MEISLIETKVSRFTDFLSNSPQAKVKAGMWVREQLEGNGRKGGQGTTVPDVASSLSLGDSDPNQATVSFL